MRRIKETNKATAEDEVPDSPKFDEDETFKETSNVVRVD